MYILPLQSISQQGLLRPFQIKDTMNQDIEILRILAKYDKEIEKLFNKLLYQLSKVSLNITKIREGAFFSFDDYPEIKEKVNEVLNSYTKEQQDIILSGINTAMIKSFKANEAKFSEFSRYTNQAIIEMRNTAKNAFIESRMEPEQGLSLSQKVWNYTQQGKAEFEAGMSEILEEGLLSGTSAEELGRKLRSKLKHPDMVYKRYHLKKMTAQGKKDVVEWRRKVIDSEGKVRYVKEDLEKVGRGVYRSSRKNALRLAATEINMAYRYADYVRWNSEPFVVGFRIQLSENHTLNGKPFYDMCDELVGVYPKTFKWAGWHPRCRCIATSILVSREEMEKISDLPDDEYRNYRSPNLVKKMPKVYDEYVKKEKDRILASMDRGTTPYWVRDNYKQGDIRKKFVWERVGKTKFKTQAQKDAIQKAWDERRRKNAILAAAEKRHAKRDAAAIQEAWDKRKERYKQINRTSMKVYSLVKSSYNTIDLTNLKWLSNKKKYLLLEKEYKSIAKQIQQINKERALYSESVKDELKELADILAERVKKRVQYTTLYDDVKKVVYAQTGVDLDFTMDVGVKRNTRLYSTRKGIGIRAVKSDTLANRQAYSVDDVVRYLNEVPDVILASIDYVYLCDFYNPSDTYWAKTYKIKNFRSYASGGHGTIRFYRNRMGGVDTALNTKKTFLSTIYHETGHNIDTIVRKISKTETWATAAELDRVGSGMVSVTSYGEAALAEDFAESVKMFVNNPLKMKIRFPHRYAILNALLKLYS